MAARGAGPGEIPVAVIGRPRGIRGEVIIHPHFDLGRERLEGAEVVVHLPDGSERRLRLLRLRRISGRTVCLLEGCASIEDAKALCHGKLLVSREALAPLDECEYYAADLLGCEVVLTGGEKLGTVSAASESPGAGLLAVEGEGGREFLIPMARSIVVEVDLRRRRIVVEPPPGLLEINED